ncbi:MAG TPA: GNAT family N-acetyltransferase [Candidatus Paceibacterota bacterium]
MISIERIFEASEGMIEDINRLLPQLRASPEEHNGSLAELQTIVGDKNAALIVARDEKKIVGMATLYMIAKFSKRTGTVEDVVVDSAYRGRGLASQILKKLIDIAKEEGVKTLSLTSRPAREAANKLYQKLGFERKETNVYRMKL